MPRYKVEENYLMKIWRTKVYECDAENEQDVYDGKIENEKILSDEKVESELDGWSEIEDIYKIDRHGKKIE